MAPQGIAWLHCFRSSPRCYWSKPTSAPHMWLSVWQRLPFCPPVWMSFCASLCITGYLSVFRLSFGYVPVCVCLSLCVSLRSFISSALIRLVGTPLHFILVLICNTCWIYIYIFNIKNVSLEFILYVVYPAYAREVKQNLQISRGFIR